MTYQKALSEVNYGRMILETDQIVERQCSTLRMGERTGLARQKGMTAVEMAL